MEQKKIGILTLNSNDNFGNKLQNYALKNYIEKYNYHVDTLWFYNNFKTHYKSLIKKVFPINKNYKREKYFENFTRKYLNRKYYPNYNINNLYDKFVVGSDQVWNYKFKGVRNNFNRYFLDFADKEKNISYAASISVDSIDKDYENKFKENLRNIKSISVREEKAEKQLKQITKRKDIQTLVDPTMLLTATEWENIAKKPKRLKKYKGKKYILNYFLGELSQERKNKIQKIAQENNCYIINILDKNDPFYVTGPSEFLWLEKNAFLICTDSFHSSVFAILFDRPFLVFERENKGWSSMNSRIDTLLSKFKLEDRRFNDKEITKENLKHDYTEAYKILEKERIKSEEFLKKTLDIE